MAKSLVQSNKARGNDFSPSASFASTPAQGNLLVTVVAANENSGDRTFTMSASGWTLVPTNGDSNNSGFTRCWMYYKVAGASEPTLVNGTTSSNTQWFVAVAEFNDPAGTTSTQWALDVSAKAQGSSSAPASGTTAATSVADAVAVAGLAQKNTGTFSAPTNSFTITQQDKSTGSTGSDTSAGLLHRLLTATGTVSTAVSSINNAWAGNVAVFYAITATTYNDTPSGGIVLGGSVAQAKTSTDTAFGGLVLGGSVSQSLIRAVTPSGGIVLGGTCTSNSFRGYSDAPSGGIVLGGSAASSSARGYADTPSGGIVLGGSVTVVRLLVLSATPSGGIVLGGGVTHNITWRPSPSGGIVLGGGAIAFDATWTVPVSDLLDGTWTDQLGTTNLYPAIDEPFPDDADYIKSASSPPAVDICQVALSPAPDPHSSTNHVLTYRYGSNTDAYVTVSQTLTPTQADAITDYSQLSVKFEAK